MRPDTVLRGAAWLYAVLEKLERPRARWFALAAALLLVSPSLVSDFALDDYVLLYQLDRPDGEWAGSAPFDLFRWMDPAHNRRLIDGEGMPWWTYEGATCAFLRPLSSLSHTLDHWLWAKSAFAMHLHSSLWFALLIVLVFALYSTLLESRWVAGVACAMFALDSAHGTTVGWISNRNALISAAFGVGAVLAHHRRRNGAGAGLAVAAYGCCALSLSAAELGVAVLAYVLAYAAFYDRAPLRSRLLSTLPYLALAGVWNSVRNVAQYGTYGLGAYVDPVAEPWAFARGLPARYLVLMSSQISRVGADLYDLLPVKAQPVLLAWAVCVCAGLLWVAWPSLRAQRAMRFFAAAAALSVVPLTATVPSDRLLTLVGVAVMPVLAQVMHDALQAARLWGSRALLRPVQLRIGVALLLACAHFIYDPVMLPLLSLSPALVGKGAAASEASLTVDPALRDKTVIVAEVPDSVMLSYLPVMRSFNGKPRPDKLYWLAASQAPARFERRGPNVLRVSSEVGLFDRRSEARSPDLALHKGDRVALSQMTVEIVELTPDGRPKVCDFVFAQPLDSPKYLWRTWRDGRLQPFRVPLAS
jgi:hypothetical protein